MRNFLATDVNPKTIECQILHNFFFFLFNARDRFPMIAHKLCEKRYTNGNRKTQRIFMVSNVSLARTKINKIYKKQHT